MSTPGPVTEFQRQHWNEGAARASATDSITTEEPLEIRLRGQSIAVTMRTPGHDTELAAGFLFSENILKDRSEILEIAHCPDTPVTARGNIINVFTPAEFNFDTSQLSRHFFTSSSCGVCGRSALEEIQRSHSPLGNDSLQIKAETLIKLPPRLKQAQATFSKTGGLHAAGLFNPSGELIVSREDIGRHNAVDKVLGHAFLNEIKLNNMLLLVSGRVSFEIIQKALVGRIPFIAAISAPSSLAIQSAEENGQTLVAFLREHSLNLYTGPHRLT